MSNFPTKVNNLCKNNTKDRSVIDIEIKRIGERSASLATKDGSATGIGSKDVLECFELKDDYVIDGQVIKGDYFHRLFTTILLVVHLDK